MTTVVPSSLPLARPRERFVRNQVRPALLAAVVVRARDALSPRYER